jgi:hypothetical protein
VYEKTDIVLRCEIDGLPAPKIHWTKDGAPVVTSNYVIDEGNELRILGLLMEDAGFYQCHGSNELGSIQTIAQLMVLKNGEI